ncbi:MAG: hypothetical protein MJE68_32010 [Proteobacteria bacterium]|nr:hypothetical protein [Pseudomonadota bacterium]
MEEVKKRENPQDGVTTLQKLKRVQKLILGGTIRFQGEELHHNIAKR